MPLRAERSLHQVYPGQPQGIDIVDNASANYLATVRPRLGYATGSALIYVTGGLAVTTLQQSHSAKEFGYGPAGSCYPTPDNYCNNPVSASDTEVGWTVGGGVEWAICRNWSVKAEYLFADFGTENTTSNLAQSPHRSSRRSLITMPTSPSKRLGLGSTTRSIDLDASPGWVQSRPLYV